MHTDFLFFTHYFVATNIHEDLILHKFCIVQKPYWRGVYSGKTFFSLAPGETNQT